MTAVTDMGDRAQAIAAIIREMAGPRTVSAAAPRLRLGAPSPARVVRVIGHPMERAAPAIAWLRGNGVSVSSASCTIHGSTWHVSCHPRALNAVEVIALAEQLGFGQQDRAR
ncbi:MAG: hypothetical protein CVT77_06440 [Alphaproteobacteria bacterium HGW-Alphaproteobacteria-16]|nr:MAG: hypothetical protein CVT77_06440 [Alphaproteobacteria bacterium HGW-Alphaproteobacteria-16]